MLDSLMKEQEKIKSKISERLRRLKKVLKKKSKRIGMQQLQIIHQANCIQIKIHTSYQCADEFGKTSQI